MPKRKREEDRESDGIPLSILFIPFDAAIQHYRRNARNGVLGVFIRSDTSSRPSSGETESVGTSMTREELSDALPTIIQNACDEARRGDTEFDPPDDMRRKIRAIDSENKDKPERRTLERRLRDPTERYPDLLFLSEKPTLVSFPKDIALTSGVRYVRLGKTTTTNRRVQKIYAYVRHDLAGSSGHAWHFRSLTKLAASGQTEHPLIVSYTNNEVTCTVVGVHLTASNVGASFSDQKAEIKALASFCKANGIQFAIGDFNIDMRQFGGGVGARFGSGLFYARNTPSFHDVRHIEQYTNSVNDSHFMGYYIADTERISLDGTTIGQLHGLSLSRSIGGDYFSDHAPIHVRLRCRP